MPIISNSTYTNRPFYFPSRHLETIIPSIFNKTNQVTFEDERLELQDGDFLDLGWLKGNNRKLLVACHGLEGSHERHYIKRSARYFSKKNWDYLGWSYRGCGSELNRLPKQYYYGGIDDFSAVIDHALNTKRYDQIILLGFSMGGCLVNKYLGSKEDLDDRIKGGVSFSVSCDLKDSVTAVQQHHFGFYDKVFVKKLKDKLRLKAEAFDEIRSIPVNSIKSFDDYHKYYTLRFHHLDSIEDFYKKSSCINYLDQISKPNLIVNALNDPILGERCYPYEKVKNHSFVFLETPKYGSHLGFSLPRKEFSWMEVRTNEFIENQILK